MPSARQRTVNIDVTAASLGDIHGLSTSDSTRLKAMFPASPIHSGIVTVDERKRTYMEQSLSAVVNDGGHTFGTVSTDYVRAPDLNQEVDTNALNLPSPYVPNPTSPGPGSQNAADKPAAPEGFGQTPSETYGSGVGSRLTPKAASERIARQTLGSYIMGKSSSDSEA